MTLAVKRRKKLELKKHVSAIHSSNKLSLIQRKIANALLFNAYNDLLTQDEHKIHIGRLCELIGYNSKDDKKIKNALIALISTVIEWNLVDGEKLDEDGIWNASAIIADASIDGPICTYSYSNKMRNLLHRPELYGCLNMLVQAKFKSSYGLALYENCIRYQNISQTPWFDTYTFRKLMGVSDGKYAKFRDFKRRVIDIAILEVNKHSPINVTPKYRKEGRKVIAMQFLIEYAENDVLLLSRNLFKDADKPLTERLKDEYGFSSAQTECVLSKYSDDYILEKISLIENSSTFKKGKIANLARYLESALNKDYQPPKSSVSQIAMINKIKEEKRKSNEIMEHNIEKYRRYQDKEIIKKYDELELKEKSALEREFADYIKNNIYFDLFLKEGIKNVLVTDQFCNFIRATRKTFLEGIASFENYICDINPENGSCTRVESATD